VPAARRRSPSPFAVGPEIDQQRDVERSQATVGHAEPHPHPLRGAPGSGGQLLLGAQRQAGGASGAQRDERAQVLDHQVGPPQGATGDERAHHADAGRGQREPLGEQAAHAERGRRRGSNYQPTVYVEPRHGERGFER
jgi:hypothetical protein